MSTPGEGRSSFSAACPPAPPATPGVAPEDPSLGAPPPLGALLGSVAAELLSVVPPAAELPVPCGAAFRAPPAELPLSGLLVPPFAVPSPVALSFDELSHAAQTARERTSAGVRNVRGNENDTNYRVLRGPWREVNRAHGGRLESLGNPAQLPQKKTSGPARSGGVPAPERRRTAVASGLTAAEGLAISALKARSGTLVVSAWDSHHVRRLRDDWSGEPRLCPTPGPGTARSRLRRPALLRSGLAPG